MIVPHAKQTQSDVKVACLLFGTMLLSIVSRRSIMCHKYVTIPAAHIPLHRLTQRAVICRDCPDKLKAFICSHIDATNNFTSNEYFDLFQFLCMFHHHLEHKSYLFICKKVPWIFFVDFCPWSVVHQLFMFSDEFLNIFGLRPAATHELFDTQRVERP